jgi:molybdopterin molybdotransferase
VDLNAADNRVAAADITSAVNLPPFRSSAMDGIAVAANRLADSPPFDLRIAGESRAGHPLSTTTQLNSGDCVRIFTGAPLPAELDTVIIQEDCEFVAGEPLPRAIARVQPKTGDNVRGVGHDIAAGQQIVASGERLNPFTVGWLSACGESRVRVVRRPRVSIFSTGDELREPGNPLEPGQIYDANRILLRRMLARLPVDVSDLGILPDDPDAIRSALTAAASQSDMMITSAGVSVGEADFVAQLVKEIGVLEVWRLLIKPGKPLAFGRLGDCLFFGLPGNPVSTVVTFLIVARQALLRLCGTTCHRPVEYSATLADKIYHKAGREEFQRGQLKQSSGNLIVHTTGDQGSNRLASFHAADCLIRIDKELGDLSPGTNVPVLPFEGLL